MTEAKKKSGAASGGKAGGAAGKAPATSGGKAAGKKTPGPKASAKSSAAVRSALPARVFITGASGFIGPALLQRFSELGVSDLVLNRLLRQHTEISRGALAMLMRRHTYSIAKAEALLGYAPAVGLAEGMEKTEAWLRVQGLISR